MTSWRQPGDFGWLIVWLAPIFPLAQKTNSRLKEARKLRFEVREYSHVWAGRACSEHDELLAGGAPCGSSAGRRVHRPRRLWDMHAIEASELARKMPPGPKRNDA